MPRAQWGPYKDLFNKMIGVHCVKSGGLLDERIPRTPSSYTRKEESKIVGQGAMPESRAKARR